jgi:hypothetical protein
MDITMTSAEALEWIIDFLESKNIPYLICGGLAAIAYGSQRPLHDIDLYVPEKNYKAVVDFGRKFITYGPERAITNQWNVEYVQFNYYDQKIEVGSSNNIQIFDSIRNEWHQKSLDFNIYTEVTVLGKTVRVIDKQQLINYKEILGREVDKIDIQ